VVERRECTRVAWRSSDFAVAAALRGGDTEGVCPYAVGKEVAGGGHTGIPAHAA
jgi:hypothetical protein